MKPLGAPVTDSVAPFTLHPMLWVPVAVGGEVDTAACDSGIATKTATAATIKPIPQRRFLKIPLSFTVSNPSFPSPVVSVAASSKPLAPGSPG